MTTTNYGFDQPEPSDDVDIVAAVAAPLQQVDTQIKAIEDATAAGFQPLDSDLTAIAALTTTAYGRSLLELANAAVGRTAFGLGTAAVAATGDFDAAGAAAAAQAASQPLDSDLTAIAALSTTAYGRAFLALADATAGRTALGLGTAAVVNTGTGAGNAILGNDARLSDTRTPTDGTVTDAKVASGAAIATSKLADASLITGAAQKASNLSDVTSAASSRTNLGLGTAATANKVAAGATGVLDATDATTTNARTPTSHTDSLHSDGPNPKGGLFKIAESDVSGSPPVSFDIQSIPATYQHLYIVCSLRSDVVATIDSFTMSFNNDTTNANYDREYLRGNAATASANEALTARTAGLSSGASSAAGLTTTAEILVANYALTTLFKVSKCSSWAWATRSAGGLFIQEVVHGWASTTAINRVTIAPVTGTHWAAGSTISIYGIAAGA